MNDEFDESETVHIVGDDTETSRFFEKMMKDLSVLDRIPKGSTIEIVPNESGARNPECARAISRRAVSSVEFGDQTIYILDVPPEDHAAD
jgi:hypothetical protein